MENSIQRSYKEMGAGKKNDLMSQMQLRPSRGPPVQQAPEGPLEFTCKSDDLERDVNLLQELIRSPMMSARLRSNQRKEAVSELAQRVPVLYNDCRPMFEKALRPLTDADRQILGFMLEQMRAVEATVRQGHVEKASETVGQYLFDRFVAPKIDDRKEPRVTELKDDAGDTKSTE